VFLLPGLRRDDDFQPIFTCRGAVAQVPLAPAVKNADPHRIARHGQDLVNFIYNLQIAVRIYRFSATAPMRHVPAL
jgi:hypothetical protein